MRIKWRRFRRTFAWIVALAFFISAVDILFIRAGQYYKVGLDLFAMVFVLGLLLLSFEYLFAYAEREVARRVENMRSGASREERRE